MSKRHHDEDEDTAEAELAAAIAAAEAAPPDEVIDGLGQGSAMVHFEVPGEKVKQYTTSRLRGEKKLVLLYLTIRGLAETPRLLLAECGAEYTHLASPMSEDQSISCEWRKRSPNGLAPMMSGLGVPRAKPISQSGTIVRFLAHRYGMAGADALEAARADVLFETSKDLKSKGSEIVSGELSTSGAKGAQATAAKIAAMLDDMPDAADDAAALNYGQIELLTFLIGCDEMASGCVKALSPALDAFRASGAARPRIAKYLKSPLRLPAMTPDYKYKAGPVKRADLAM